MCATTVSRNWTKIRGVCVHSVGQLQLTKEWTENTTYSGPSKGSVVAPHTQRIRISLVFLDTCLKNPWCARRQYPDTGQECVVLVSTPSGSCGSRKSGQKTPRILVHQRVVSLHSTHKGFGYHSFFPTLATRILGVRDDSIQKLDKNTWCLCPLRWAAAAHERVDRKTPRILVHEKWECRCTADSDITLVPAHCHKNPWYVRRQDPEKGQEFVVLVSTPLGRCGSRKSGQKTPRILVHQRVVSWHSRFGYHSFS